METTIRARARSRLRVKALTAGRPILYRPAISTASLVGPNRVSPFRPPAKESEEPLGTIGAPTAPAPLLEGALFAGWVPRSRCNLGYSMLEVLNDYAWDVWRVSQVTTGLNGAQRALVRICQGEYQVPRSVRCDLAFVWDQNAASIAASSSFLFPRRTRCPHVS